jgi:hypothetical protein
LVRSQVDEKSLDEEEIPDKPTHKHQASRSQYTAGATPAAAVAPQAQTQTQTQAQAHHGDLEQQQQLNGSTTNGAAPMLTSLQGEVFPESPIDDDDDDSELHSDYGDEVSDDSIPSTRPRPIKRRLSTYESIDGGVDLEHPMAGSARR